MGIIDTLFSECEGYIELRSLGKRKESAFFLTSHTKEMKQWINERKKHSDLYFAVATRDGKAGKRENVVSIPAVWIDIDFKDAPGGEATALDPLNEFPLQPTIRVRSGGGLHAYWKLKEPATLEEADQLEAIMRGLAVRLNGDIKCAEVARILRIPDTKNQKYTPPRPVVLEHCNGTEFSLSDFDDLVDYSPKRVKAAKDGSMAFVLDGVPEGERDNAIFKYACRLRSLNLDRYEAEELVLKAARNCKPAFPLNDAMIKLNQAWKLPSGHGEDALEERVTSVTGVTSVPFCHQSHYVSPDVTSDVTRMSPASDYPIEHNWPELSLQPSENQTQIIKDWIETCDGIFTIQDMARELQLKSTKSYSLLKQVLKRLVTSKTIERVGNTRGVYQRVEADVCEMDWWDCEEELEYGIELPLGMSDLVKILPKNIIIIAGEKNSCKTALALNIAKSNMDKTQVHYFTSEMGKVELKQRLMSFEGVTIEKWKKVKFYDKATNFHHFMRPNDLNIIDYLEIHEEFYRMGGILRQIHDSLENGVAVVCLQKKPGMDTGKGGEVTLEKARLAIALSTMTDMNGRIYNQAKIVKAKTPRDQYNHPQGMVIEFNIIGGWKVWERGTWHREIEQPKKSRQWKH